MNIDFFCLQPIKLSKEIFINIHQKKYIPNSSTWIETTSKNSVDRLKNSNIPEKWFSEIKSIKRQRIYINNSNYNKFNSDMQSMKELKIFTKSLSINSDKSGFMLGYDYDYKVFFLVYCLSIDVISSIDPNELKDMYANIRNQLVIDSVNGNTDVSEWAKKIRSFAIKEISNEFKNIKSNGQIEIIENTGYICSLYSEFDKLNIEELNTYKEDFLHSNHNIDLVDEKKYQYASLSINKGGCKGLLSNGADVSSEELFSECNSIVFLGWRFTTLYGIKENKDFKLIPLLINIQNIYFQIDNFYKPYLSELYEEVRYNNDYVSLSENLKLFDKLVVSFQNLVYEKERFVSELKPFQFEVFSAIEDYWSLTSDYKNIEKTLHICQTSLERKLNIKNNKIQQKQSDILFVLAIIQIFSIISILGDYFSLFDMNDVSEENKNLYNMSKEYTIYVLAMSSIALIFFAYIEKLWYSATKVIRNIFRY